mgnify:CR=1 FL=1
MDSNNFERLTEEWLSLASKFATKIELESHISNKIGISNRIYNHLESVISRFMETAIGESVNYYEPNLSHAIDIKRLLPKINCILNSSERQYVSEIISNTFLYGILTQLYLHHFPTRDKYLGVHSIELENKWIIDAVAADVIMGYYGDKNNPICMNIFELQFKDNVKSFLKGKFKINMFRMGKFHSYFRNLYIAGALLIMDCDLATKKLHS